MALVPEEPAAPAEPAAPGRAPGWVDTPIGPVAKRLCLGMTVVPYTTVVVFDEQGEYHNVDFVDLSRTSGGSGYSLFSWLWEPLGFTKKQWANSKPWQLPLMRELKEAVSGRRVKRNRQGHFVDGHGNMTPKVIAASVRGRPLKVLNDPRKIMVNLVESEDTLAWFVKELLGDLRRGADDPGDQLVAAAGSAEDAPGEVPGQLGDTAAGSAKDVPGDQLVPSPGELLEKTLRSLREQAKPTGRSVCFDKAHNRFKVSAKGSPPQYTLVRGWAKLMKQGGTVFAMEVALAEASASVLEKWGSGEQVANGAASGAEEVDGNKSLEESD